MKQEILDPYLHDIPKEIVEASILISEWMEKNGYKNWALHDIQKRVYPERPATKFPAAYIAHWPNQSIAVCERHKAAVDKIAGAMGLEVTCTMAPANTQCVNCINESKIRGS